ncbi:MAG: glycosyl hydrolase 2 galactose-binding domain-containing protein, partial [bacterium]
MRFQELAMIPLSGRWDLSDSDGDYTLSVTFPGDIHTALLEHGIIPDPFLARNELEVQWVGARDWIARRTFELEESELEEYQVDVNGPVPGKPARQP